MWPAALTAAAQPFRSQHLGRGACAVVLDRDGGDLDRTRRLGWARFERAVRREITRRGGQKPCLRIARNLYTALADPAGVLAHRRGALERVGWVLADWEADPTQRWPTPRTGWSRSSTSSSLTALATSIHGISAVGAAAILAETGDPHRFPTARALVKHAGLAPRQRQSGTYTGQTRLTGKGRPRLRVAAWRAVWGALQTNTVYANRYRHLTTRETQQAQAHPGPDRDRRRDPAAPARRDHHRPSLGPPHRQPTGPTQQTSPWPPDPTPNRTEAVTTS